MRTNRLGRPRGLCFALLLCLVHVRVGAGYSHTFTSCLDFTDRGVLHNVNCSDYPDQLQIDAVTTPFPYIWVALSNVGTVIKVDIESGAILGEYNSAPESMAKDPSRTTVDRYGNVWAGNRAEATGDLGSVIKVGLIFGGERGFPDPANPGGFVADPFGPYVKDPVYNQCHDRNRDGLIRTSVGLRDVLPWPDGTDGTGSPCDAVDPDAQVKDAEDECIAVFQRVHGTNVRHVSLDPNNDVWIGGNTNSLFDLIDDDTGCILRTRQLQRGGYGGISDCNGVVWSVASGEALARYDPASDIDTYISHSSYGVSIDSQGFIWVSDGTDGTVYKVHPLLSTIMLERPVDPFSECSGMCFPSGIAVRLRDDSVWTANRYCNYRGAGYGAVSRMDFNGDLIKVIPLLDPVTGDKGRSPTGVAVDTNGKVWVINLSSGNLMRIDPDGGLDGKGEVDLTVPIPESKPYVYSDMTGLIPLAIPAFGFWSVMHDGGCGAGWDRVSWNGEPPLPSGSEHEPSGTTLRVEVRAANTPAGLGWVPFQQVQNGVSFGPLTGRYIEVRTNFVVAPGAHCGVYATPLLTDLTVHADGPVLDAGPGLHVCGGDPVTLTGGGALAIQCPEGLEFRWSWPGHSGTWSADPVMTDAPGSTTTYTLEVRCPGDPNCVFRDDVTVDLEGWYPSADAGPDADICLGDPVTVEGSLSSAPHCVTGLEYRWSWPGYGGAWSADPTAADTPAADTTYTLDVRCASSPDCMSLDTVAVRVHDRPVAVAGSALSVCENDIVTLDGSGSSHPSCATGLAYRFSVPGFGVVRGWSADPAYTFTASAVGTTTYVLDVFCNDFPSCVASDQTSVEVRDCSTAVSYAWYEAHVKDGSVVVRWQTLSEDSTLGFMVLRRLDSLSEGSPVSAALTPARGPGVAYQVVDPSPPASPDLAYRVLEVSTSGPGDSTPWFGAGSDEPSGRGPINRGRGHHARRTPGALIPPAGG